jgi:hypothetical protein
MWEYNIKIDVKETAWGGVSWIIRLKTVTAVGCCENCMNLQIP